MKVKCNVCRNKFDINDRDVDGILAKNKGWIPCSSCGSHATSWKHPKLPSRTK